MSLPPAAPQRQPKHHRQIEVQVSSRGSEPREVDRPRVAGTPVHDRLRRLVANEQLDALAAGSGSRRMPYPVLSNTYGAVNTRLVGQNLLKDFRAQLRRHLGGVLGRTHISELGRLLPGTTVQAFAGAARRLHHPHLQRACARTGRGP